MDENEKTKKEVEKILDKNPDFKYLKKYTDEIVKVVKMAKKEFGKPFGGLKITDLNCVICGKKAESCIIPKPIQPEEAEDNEKLFLAIHRQNIAEMPIPICNNHSQEEIEEKDAIIEKARQTVIKHR